MSSTVNYTPDDFIDVRVIAAGDDCNLYSWDTALSGWRLAAVHHADQPAPGDQAIVLGTNVHDSGLRTLLLRQRAVFPDCVVSARPIAGLEILRGQQREYCVIAVANADDTLHAVNAWENIPEELRHSVEAFLNAGVGTIGTELIWHDAVHAYQTIHQARQAARIAQARTRQQAAAPPAWKPLGQRVRGAKRSADAEPHTEAEYAYQQLPSRFQKYVDEYLTSTERLLFATQRPAMRSGQRRGWQIPQLQEGLLVIGDQQVAFVAEILPLGQDNVRYGYVVQAGAPERITAAALRPIGAHLGLEISWGAAGGNQNTVWEFPPAAANELDEAVKLLRDWLPTADDRRLRRAQPPEAQEMELHDPAANSPDAVRPLIERLRQAISAHCQAGERVLAQALLPAWADKRKIARVLAVTNRRVMLVPDPEARQNVESFPLEQITFIELTASILQSQLAINYLHTNRYQRFTLDFPYTAVGFRDCFTMLRRQLAIVPPFS